MDRESVMRSGAESDVKAILDVRKEDAEEV